jgi:outer membrane protein OmpA-like peptidoglycan-associated protein
MNNFATFSTILPPPPLSAFANGTDVTVYQGSDGKIDLTPEGGIAPYDFKWSNGRTLEDPSDLVKGVYDVIVTDAIGQVAKVSVPIREPEPIITTVEVPEIILPQTVIYFDLNSSYLNKENYIDLDAFAKKMKEYKNTKLTVVSRCDKRESDTYNIWLSKRRMETTINYLVKKGIDRSRITGSYKGEREPDIKCSNYSEDQFTKNRRTTIKVSPF